MSSRFTGRDYSTLRSEIIEFLRVRLPKNWDYNNLADPVVIFAESLARVGDQLHYTIDELRRECDVATAKRASSIYSYAMREGYKMMLPRASFGTIAINTTKEQDGLLHLNLKQFDEIIVNPIGESLYVVNNDNIDADLHAPVDETYFKSLRDYEAGSNNTGNASSKKTAMSIYQSYYEDVYNKTQHVKVVLGVKGEFPFTYNDINNDSTVELPNPLIDRNLVRLSYANKKTGTDEYGMPKYVQLKYVDDVISSGFDLYSFTLTPKFIGGAVTLCIEFPTNYRDIFNSDTSTTFKFEYISIKNAKVEPLDEYSDNTEAITFPEGAITIVSGHEEDPEIVNNGLQYRVNFGDGIKGYAEYENALVTRDNYKKFVQNYSALLTKDDYANYIKALTHTHCKVYDHGDMYKIPAVLPEDADLIPRAIYILTDSNYSGREALWNDLKERSSRSDCIVMMPFGKDPYSIIIKAECYLVGTSIASIATQIEQSLTLYYGRLVGEKIPKISMINYLTHKASDKVVRMESKIVRDSTYGAIDTTFNSVNQLDNDEIDYLFNAIGNSDISYKSPLSEADASAEDANEEYRYWLRNVLYEDEDGNFYTEDELNKINDARPTESKIVKTIKHYYCKYPQLTYKVYIDDTHQDSYSIASEYRDFPESFPKIYYINQHNQEVQISEYEDLIDHQVGYGELDSEDWDINDTSIYNVKNGFEQTNDIIFKYREDHAHGSNVIDVKIPIAHTNYWRRSEGEELKIVADSYVIVLTWPSGESTYTEELHIINNSVISFGTDPDTGRPTPPEDYPRMASDPVPCTSDYKQTINPVIKSDYIKHHYMVPVLDKVVVLIKSISSMQ